MTARVIPSTAIYKEAKDWHVWSDAIEAKARQVNLWQYFEGKPWPKEPRYPEPNDFEHERPHARSETVTQAVATDEAELQLLQAEVEELPPSPADGIHDRNNSDYPHLHGAVLHRRRIRDKRLRQELAERSRRQLVELRNEETVLSAQGKELYNMAVTRYTHARRDYDRQQRDASTLLDWTYTSVAPQYLHLLKNKDLVERYEALEAFSLPFVDKVKEETRDAYEQHMAAFKKSEKKLNDWITRWMYLLAEAESHGLEDITDPERWCSHLMRRLRETQQGQAWVLGEFSSLEPKIKSGRTSYVEVAAKMQLRLVVDQPSEKGGEKRRFQGAFPAYNGANDDEDSHSEATARGARRIKRESSTPSRGQSARGRSRGSSGRPSQGRQVQSVEECELCSRNGHELNDCYHTYPDNHPDLPAWWNSTCGPLVKRTIARLLKADTNLAERVRKIKESRAIH